MRRPRRPSLRLAIPFRGRSPSPGARSCLSASAWAEARSAHPPALDPIPSACSPRMQMAHEENADPATIARGRSLLRAGALGLVALALWLTVDQEVVALESPHDD